MGREGRGRREPPDELIGRNRQVGLRACAACSLNGASRGGCRLRGGARDVGACTAPIQARLAHKRTSSPSTRLAPSNPAVSPLIRHGDGQAREQGRLEGQARVVQAQLLGLDAFGQEDCHLLPVTQRGSHDRSDQGGASTGALSCLLRLLRSSMCSKDYSGTKTLCSTGLVSLRP